jgi:cell division protein ZapB
MGGIPVQRRDMSKFEELAERVERLLLRHDELRRTHALLEQQCAAVTLERDHLRSRLSAARNRIDTLLARLPVEPAAQASDGKGLQRDAP